MSKRLNIETSACERERNLETKNIVRVQETPLVDGCRKGLVPETERVRFDEVQLQIPTSGDESAPMFSRDENRNLILWFQVSTWKTLLLPLLIDHKGIQLQ